MAKTVGDLLIKLEAEGLESITALKSAFKSLGKASLSTDKQLEKFRKEVVEVAKATKVSQQSIRGQIDAFKGLKQQATIGSTVYRKLGKDIDALTESLDKLNKKEEEAAKKPRTAAQIFKTGGVAVIPYKFNRQIAAGNELLQKIGVTSAEYGTQLAAITVRTQEFTRAQQRQQVVAQNLVATNRAQTTGFLQSTKVNIENTHTTAALKQKIAELAQDLDNIDVGSKEYITTSNRLKEAQQELNQVLGISSAAFDDLSRAQERAERRAKKLADIQQYYGTSRTGEGQAAQRAGGFRDPATGAMIARGTRAGRVSLAQQPVREISSLYQSIGAIGMSGIIADIDRMGKSFEEVSRDIRSATLASNGSINSLQAQRTAMAQLRAGLDPTSQDFRELGREIDKVDRKLSKIGKRAKGFDLKGAAQTVGAVASAGIFGGAPGAAGAILGAPFGPGGAVLGGGIATSVAVGADQIQGFTDYAASIALSEKALKRLIAVENNKMESDRRFEIAQQTIEYAVKRLNVEREDATTGMARLSAAVLGAGGNIEAAALSFLATTKAIKATKGSADDVRGGLTALVQMFSKGRISAEELSGQLGERFPAAVTAFAEANEISTQELQAMLKKGEVGLDKLMKFMVFVANRYRKGALDMAASTEESGERQKRTFDEVRRRIGEQLTSVGERLQTGLSDSLETLAPLIVDIATVAANVITALVDGIVFVIKNFRNLIDVVVVLAGGTVLGSLLTMVQRVTAAMGAKGMVHSVKLLHRFIRFKLVTSVGLLIGKLRALALTMARNPLTLLALGFTAIGVAAFRASRRHRDFIDDIGNGMVSVEEATEKLGKYKQRVKDLQTIQGIIERDPKAVEGLTFPHQLGIETSQGSVQQLVKAVQQNADLPPIKLGSTKEGVEEALDIASAQVEAVEMALAAKLAPEDGGIDLEELFKKYSIPGLDLEDSSDEGASKKQFMLKAELELRRQLREAISKEDEILQSTVQRNLDLLAASQETEDAVKRTNMQEEARHAHAIRLKKIHEAEAEMQRELSESLEDRQFKLGMITQEEYNQLLIARERKKLEGKGASEGTIEDTLAVMRQELDPDFATRINVELQEMKKNFKELVNPANQVIGAAKAIGSNFKTAFMDVITGSKSAKQALADFFKRTAEYFLEMAADIIAKQLVMITLQTILRALGAAIGSSSSTTPPTTTPDGVGQAGMGLNIQGVDQGINPFVAANGAYFQGGFRKFADGGSVNKPTLGLVGEGGESEYIIPESKMRESMKRYSRGARGSAVIPTERGATSPEMEGGVVGAGAIDVRYTVERINNVDYVTADQFQQGMQRAAAEGAARGEQQTLRKLQMSGSTRRRLGM